MSRYGNSSKKRASTLKHIDRLIIELSKKCKYAKDVDCPGLVEMNRALKSTRRLRKMINNKRKTKILQWEIIFDSIVFLTKFVKKLYSIFVNCIRNGIFRYEFWKNNTVITHGRRYSTG